MVGPVKAKDAAGFTLIELMIVVAVLALLTTTLSLSVNRPRGGQSADWARFEAVHNRLRQEAVLARQITGLSVSPEGYQRLRWSDGDWRKVGDLVGWRDAVMVLEPFDAAAPLEFAPSGQSTALRIRFEAGAGNVICEGDGWSPVSCGAG